MNFGINLSSSEMFEISSVPFQTTTAGLRVLGVGGLDSKPSRGNTSYMGRVGTRRFGPIEQFMALTTICRASLSLVSGDSF